MYEPGLVCCFMGTLGAGKTLLMSVLGASIASQQGVNIYANYKTKFADRINGIQHLVQLENGLMLIDEAQSLLDSREFGKNVDITQWLLLIRKVRLGMFYTTQHIDFVDKRLREITDVLFWCQKAYNYGQKCTKVNTYRLLGNDAIHTGTMALSYQSWMFDLYDTNDREVKLTIDGYGVPYNIDMLTAKSSQSKRGSAALAALPALSPPPSPLPSSL